MPFGPYADWDACIADQTKKGRSEESAKRICGYIKARTEKGMRVVEKASEKRYTLGVVYEPDAVDTQGEFAKAEAIEEAAWDFMTRMQVIAQQGAQILKSVEKVQKSEDVNVEIDVTELSEEVEKGNLLDDQHLQIDEALGTIVESYVAPVDMELNGETVRKGSWLLGVVWTKAMFDKIKRGERTGLSMYGHARRVED